jgi:hypothetical protein
MLSRCFGRSLLAAARATRGRQRRGERLFGGECRLGQQAHERGRQERKHEEARYRLLRRSQPLDPTPHAQLLPFHAVLRKPASVWINWSSR